MLMPKRVKHRKQQRGSMKGRAYRGNKVTYGDFGIMAMEPTWITSNQIEAARVAMTRHIKRGGDVWIKIFPDKPVSAKPIGTRMGSGKGAPEYWVAVVKPGRVMFEIGGVAEETAKGYVSELMGKTADELQKDLVSAKKELFNLRFQNATNQLDNTARIKEVRKNIARIQTVMTQKAREVK